MVFKKYGIQIVRFILSYILQVGYSKHGQDVGEKMSVAIVSPTLLQHFLN